MSQILPPSRADEDESSGAAVSVLPVAKVTPPQLRKMQISEFCAWLRTQTNKHKRPEFLAHSVALSLGIGGLCPCAHRL